MKFLIGGGKIGFGVVVGGGDASAVIVCGNKSRR